MRTHRAPSYHGCPPEPEDFAQPSWADRRAIHDEMVQTPVTSQDPAEWRMVRHPFKIFLRGWHYGQHAGGVCLVSRRGTVFDFRTVKEKGKLVPYARKLYEID